MPTSDLPSGTRRVCSRVWFDAQLNFSHTERDSSRSAQETWLSTSATMKIYRTNKVISRIMSQLSSDSSAVRTATCTDTATHTGRQLPALSAARVSAALDTHRALRAALTVCIVVHEEVDAYSAMRERTPPAAAAIAAVLGVLVYRNQTSGLCCCIWSSSLEPWERWHCSNVPVRLTSSTRESTLYHASGSLVRYHTGMLKFVCGVGVSMRQRRSVQLP